MKLPVYNSNAESTKELELDPRIFGVKPKKEVIQQVVVAQQANTRTVLAHVKDKSEVRGGGRKPWRQKGTGRARHGSIRSPLWLGGGVTFGPSADRNFAKRVNKKQKQLALAMCLTDRAADQAVAVFEKLELASGKTKDLNNWLKAVKEKVGSLASAKKLLLILDNNDKVLIKAALNLKNVNTILADSLNCVEILKADHLLISEKALAIISRQYKKNNLKK